MGKVNVTVGLDIGTTSIKAVAVDDDGAIVARTRIPHEVRIPGPELMEHDADRAWRRGPRRALAALGQVDPVAVGVTAMVPSLTAVDKTGRPLTPGLLYGDARGRFGDPTHANPTHANPTHANPATRTNPAEPTNGGEVAGFLRWSAGQAPDARGFWPAQSVANRALGGQPLIDYAVAFTSMPLYGANGWDPEICAECGVDPALLPPADMPGAPAGRVGGPRSDGPLLCTGTVDVWCEQLVAGAREVGDVHVICGTTLIVWAVNSGAPGDALGHPALWTVAHARPDQHMIGGASNAGGLFLDWVRRTFPIRRGETATDPDNIPVWTPYPRGERTPYHDPGRRAGLHELNLTQGPAHVQRAAWEASGFVVRHHLELGSIQAKRIVATGGGTRVDGWMQALADTTGLPVHVADAPEGAARGAAFLARVAAGLDRDFNEAARWAATRSIVEPDPDWNRAASDRYQRFLELSGRP
jgi:xylulokinase